MKKFFKICGILLLIIVVIAGSAATFIAVRGIPKYEPGSLKVKVESTPQRIARGKKLASILCKDCHLNHEIGLLTGRYMAEAPPQFGKIYSRNITQDPTYGIGSWTDGDLIYLLRTGIKKDGSYTPPWMVKLPLMSDEDVNSIVAFLRSDDPQVKASTVQDVPSEPSFLTKFLCTVAWKPLPMQTSAVVAPDSSNHVAFGRYLSVGVVDCYSCHSADFKTDDAMIPKHSKGFFGGGNGLLDREGKDIFTANLTPDTQTGIGNWTQYQFITAVMYSQRPDGKSLRFPMVPYVGLDSSEVACIYQYLKTVPPLHNEVKRNLN